MSSPQHSWEEVARRKAEDAARRLGYILPLLRLLRIERIEVEYRGERAGVGRLMTPAYYPTPGAGLPQGVGDFLKSLAEAALSEGKNTQGAWTYKLHVATGTTQMMRSPTARAAEAAEHYDGDWE